MLAPFAFLLFAGNSSDIDLLKPPARAFHEAKTIDDQLARATTLEQALRDWAAVQLPSHTRLPANILGPRDSLEVSRPFPDAALIRVNLQIGAGTDSAAWLYELRAGKWTRTVTLERTGRKSASRLYDLAIGPPDKSGTRLFAAVRGPSGTAGCWHTITWQLYRVATPTPPPLLMDDLHPANLCGPLPAAHAELNNFSITLQDRDLPAGATRTHILRYELFAERPTRIQPVATGPREFVHEWLESDWKDASPWTALDARAALGKTHQELANPSGDYRSVTKCPDGHLEIAVDLTNSGVRYFEVKDLGKNEFQLLAVNAAASGCATH